MSTGLANKVTALRYRTIKQYCEERDCGAQDDRTVGKIFGVGVTVVRTIRNTRDYDEYLVTVKRWHRKQTERSRKNRSVILPSSGLPLERTPVEKRRICEDAETELNSFERYILFMIILIAIAVSWLAIWLEIKGA